MKGTRSDWLKWVAAGCALVATASAEYELARAIGMHPWIAAAVPGALDAYAVRALRAHREVLTAVLAMVGVNAASHLVSAGVLAVDWRLITAVSAIAPLVLWRVHALGTPNEWRTRKIWGVPEASTEPEPEHGRGNEDQGTPNEREHPEHSVPAPVPPLPVRVPGASTFAEHAEEAVSVASTHTSRCVLCGEGVPFLSMAEHVDREHPVSVVSTESTWDDYPPVHPFPYTWDDMSTPGTPVLKLVPDPVTVPDPVPDPDFTPVHDGHGELVGFKTPSTGASTDQEHVLSSSDPSTLLGPSYGVFAHLSTDQEHVARGVLVATDTAFLRRARVLAEKVQGVPRVRALKSELGTGTARAQRLHAALTIEHDRAQEGSTP